MLLKKWFAYKLDAYQKLRPQAIGHAKILEAKGKYNTAQKIHKFINQLDEKETKLNQQLLPQSGILAGCKAIYHIWTFGDLYTSLREEVFPYWQVLIENLLFVFIVAFVAKTYIFGLYSVPTGSAEPNLLVGDRILGLKYPYLSKKPQRGELVIFDQPSFVYSKNPIQKLWQYYIGFPILGILPAGPDSWVKRVIGVAGDRVVGRLDKDGRPEVFLNGERLNEPYLNPYPVIHLRRQAGFLPAKYSPLSFLAKRTVGDPIFGMRYTFDPAQPYNEQPFYNFSKDEIVYDFFNQKPMIYYPFQGERNTDIYDYKVPENHILCFGDNRRNSLDGRVWGPLSLKLVRGRASMIVFSLDGAEPFWLFELIKNPWTFLTQKIRWSRTLRFVHPFKEIPKN